MRPNFILCVPILLLRPLGHHLTGKQRRSKSAWIHLLRMPLLGKCVKSWIGFSGLLRCPFVKPAEVKRHHQFWSSRFPHLGMNDLPAWYSMILNDAPLWEHVYKNALMPLCWKVRFLFTFKSIIKMRKFCYWKYGKSKISLNRKNKRGSQDSGTLEKLMSSV